MVPVITRSPGSASRQFDADTLLSCSLDGATLAGVVAGASPAEDWIIREW